VWRKVDSKFGLDFDHCELMDQVFTEVGQMRVGTRDFCKVTDCDGAMNAEVIGFKEHSFLLQPGEKIAIDAVELGIA